MSIKDIQKVTENRISTQIYTYLELTYAIIYHNLLDMEK